MQSYATDAKNIFLAGVISAIAGLGIQGCLAWFLLPEGRGQYAVCILFAYLLSLACALGQEMTNVYFVGSKKSTVSQALTQSIVLGILVSTVACFAGYALTHSSLPFLNKASTDLFQLSLMCIPATIFYLYFTQIFLGMGAIRTYALLTTAPRIIALTALLIAYSVHLDVRTAVLIHAGSEGFVAAAALCILLIRHAARFVRITAVHLRQSLSYGFRLYFGRLADITSVLMGTIILTLSPVMVSELGMFAAASTLAAKLWMVAEALQTAMLPRVSADPTGKSDAIAQCVRLCWPISAVVVLLVFVLSQPLISLILSPRFLPVLVPFQVLLIGVVIRVVPKILAAYFNGIGRPGINSMAIVSAVVTNIVLMLVLLPKWGLIGVSISMSIAFTVETLIITTLFCRLSKISPGRLFIPTRDDFQTLVRVSRKIFMGKQSSSPAISESGSS